MRKSKRFSILTDDLEHSYLSGMPAECIHHCFEGYGRRQISEREGFIVPLTNREHNMSNNAVHFNKKLDRHFKQLCQSKWESIGHSREEFIKLIGRSYLDDEEE